MMILKHRINNCSGRPLSDWATDFENVFEQVFGDGTAPDTDWSPRANVIEHEKVFSVDLELPGIVPDNVAVEMTDGILEVYGEKKIDEVIDGAKTIKSERCTGKFRRTFKFETRLDADNISASFKHGILSIELPKSEQVLPRKINVKIIE